MREKGEVSVTQAARLLGLHADTVRDWCQEALEGGRARLSVRQDVAGRYWLMRTEVVAYRRDHTRVRVGDYARRFT